MNFKRSHMKAKEPKEENRKNQCLFFWCERKIFPNPQSYFFLRVCKQECYYIFTYIFLHVGKKVAWKSFTSYGIVVNLFNYSKPTQELKKKKK
jgi:hypothetical protein